MLVRVKGKGLKLNKEWCYKGAEVEIEEAEYEKNKDYLDVIEEKDDNTLIPEIPVSDEEKELEELRTKAKELGIKNYYLMKIDTLKKLIDEKEAPLFGVKTQEDADKEDEDGTDDKDDSTTDKEENPEE